LRLWAVHFVAPDLQSAVFGLPVQAFIVVCGQITPCDAQAACQLCNTNTPWLDCCTLYKHGMCQGCLHVNWQVCDSWSWLSSIQALQGLAQQRHSSNDRIAAANHVCTACFTTQDTRRGVDLNSSTPGLKHCHCLFPTLRVCVAMHNGSDQTVTRLPPQLFRIPLTKQGSGQGALPKDLY
jgi:hypothetical protein